MDIIRVEDLVKLKIDADGNSQKCLGLKKDNITGLVTKISRDPGFVQVENNQASSPSIYRRDHLLHADAPAAPAAESPTSILKRNLNLALSELDATISKCERMSRLLVRARQIQRNINAAKANSVAVRKTQLIDTVSATLDFRMGVLNEDRDTGRRLKGIYNTKAAFGDISTMSYTTLIDSIRQHISEVNRFIQSAKTNMAESRYIPGIITDIVAGGKRSVTKRSGKTLRRNRKNRRTQKQSKRS